MKIMEGKRILEPGDLIRCKGITVKIKEIHFQDDFGDDGFDMEFMDTNGNYRSWKQRFDGGYVLQAQAVPESVFERIRIYLIKHLPTYELWNVMRKSIFPEDDYLYMVVARRRGDGKFAAWTCWNDKREVMNHGHYDLPDERTAMNICNEYFYAG